MSAAVLTVLRPDGSSGQSSANDQALLSAGQLLSSDANFKALQGPLLSRAEVNVGLASTAPGYLYLRYDVPSALPQELWLHWGKADHVGW